MDHNSYNILHEAFQTLLPRRAFIAQPFVAAIAAALSKEKPANSESLLKQVMEDSVDITADQMEYPGLTRKAHIFARSMANFRLKLLDEKDTILYHEPQRMGELSLDTLLAEIDFHCTEGFACTRAEKIKHLHPNNALALYEDYLANCAFLLEAIDEKYKQICLNESLCSLFRDYAELSYRSEIETLSKISTLLRPFRANIFFREITLSEPLLELMKDAEAMHAELKQLITSGDYERMPPITDITDLQFDLCKEAENCVLLPRLVKIMLSGMGIKIDPPGNHPFDYLTYTHASAKAMKIYHRVNDVCGDEIATDLLTYNVTNFPNFGNREGAWLPEKGESVPDKLTLSNYNRMLTLSAEKPYRFSEDFIATLAKIVANCQPELAQEIIQSRLETAYAYGLERTRPSINRFMPAQIIENETVNLSALKDAAKILEKYEGNFHFPRRR